VKNRGCARAQPRFSSLRLTRPRHSLSMLHPVAAQVAAESYPKPSTLAGFDGLQFVHSSTLPALGARAACL